jgi:hypothetical protein
MKVTTKMNKGILTVEIPKKTPTKQTTGQKAHCTTL